MIFSKTGIVYTVKTLKSDGFKRPSGASWAFPYRKNAPFPLIGK